MKRILAFIIILIATLIFSCAAWAQDTCNSDLQWKHVYHPDRFIVEQKCMTITGTVYSVLHEADGDNHIRIKLDPGQEKLLNQKNIDAQHGCLVVEIIYAYDCKQPDAMTASKGYKNTVFIPKVGQHVKVTGPYVLDQQHGWKELHPVLNVTVIN
jgi:hypothetical protein